MRSIRALNAALTAGALIAGTMWAATPAAADTAAPINIKMALAPYVMYYQDKNWNLTAYGLQGGVGTISIRRVQSVVACDLGLGG